MHLEAGARSIRGDNAGALLSAMLECKEAVVGQHGRVRMAEHAKDATLVHRVGRSRRWKTWVLNHRPRKDTQSVTDVTFGTIDGRRLLQLGFAGKITTPA
jgi:hypothetical protein